MQMTIFGSIQPSLIQAPGSAATNAPGSRFPPGPLLPLCGTEGTVNIDGQPPIPLFDSVQKFYRRRQQAILYFQRGAHCLLRNQGGPVRSGMHSKSQNLRRPRISTLSGIFSQCSNTDAWMDVVLGAGSYPVVERITVDL